MLQLIDWPALFFSALWIAGATLALAVVSIGQWQARIEGLRLRECLGRPAAQRALAVAAASFCVGMLGTSGSVLERVLWGILACAFALDVTLKGLQARRRSAERPPAEQPPAVQPTAVQPAAVQPAAERPGTVQRSHAAQTGPQVAHNHIPQSKI